MVPPPLKRKKYNDDELRLEISEVRQSLLQDLKIEIENEMMMNITKQLIPLTGYQSLRSL